MGCTLGRRSTREGRSAGGREAGEGEALGEGAAAARSLPAACACDAPDREAT